VNGALLGCGLVGGSFALALGDRVSFAGYDRSPENAARARERGIVSRVAESAASAVKDAELVVIAVPVRSTAEICEAIAPALSKSALVMDVGSTKSEVLTQVKRWLPFPERFVAAHPIAGTEKSGPDAASPDLFRGRRCLLSPLPETDREKLKLARELWEAAGARVDEIDAAHHDHALAFVSHLPHVAAFALASAVGEAAAKDSWLEGLSGGGFVDATRIAGSDPRMWRDVLLSNRDGVLEAMRALDEELAELRRAIAAGDGEKLEQLISRAGDGRKRVLRA
jgi:cyclohexadieny/prephenate dehydrogenase